MNGDIEIPAAVLLGAAGLLLAYGWLRTKLPAGERPFDWLWAEMDKAKTAVGSSTTQVGGKVVGVTVTAEQQAAVAQKELEGKVTTTPTDSGGSLYIENKYIDRPETAALWTLLSAYYKAGKLPLDQVQLIMRNAQNAPKETIDAWIAALQEKLGNV